MTEIHPKALSLAPLQGERDVMCLAYYHLVFYSYSSFQILSKEHQLTILFLVKTNKEAMYYIASLLYIQFVFLKEQPFSLSFWKRAEGEAYSFLFTPIFL